VPAERLVVEVVYCPRPGQCDCRTIELEAPVTVANALRASGLPVQHGLDLADIRVGVWGRAQPLDAALRTRDRVEIYRPLQVDPKEARRLRYRAQRATAAR
jgi:hypothetical protein